MMQARWKILFRPRFFSWLQEQDIGMQKRVAASIGVLAQEGPSLSRPYVDSVKGSVFQNMKELRIQCQGKPVRAFFAFDPLRQAVILCAGDKTGDKRFYERMIPLADVEYREYLEEENSDD